MADPRKLKDITPDIQLRTVRYTPDGKTLVAGTYDGRLRRWDVSGEDPKEIGMLPGHHGFIDTIACAATTNLMFTADSWGQLCAWQLGDAPTVKWKHEQAHDGWIRQIVLSADEKRLATCGRDKAVRIWSTETGERVAELAGHVDETFAVAFHPDGNTLASADALANLKHWDIGAAKCVRDAKLTNLHYYERDHDIAGVYALRFIDGGKTLVAAGSQPTAGGFVQGFPRIELVDWASLAVTKSITFGTKEDGFVFDLFEHPDGYLILITSGAMGVGQFMFLRPDEDKPFFLSKEIPNSHGLAVHLASNRVAISSTNRDSNFNGKQLDKDGKYLGNVSPIAIFELSPAS